MKPIQSCVSSVACLLLALAAAAKDPEVSPRDGKPVNGLLAKAEVNSGEVHLTLKNASDKPLAVCTWLGQRCLEVTWTGPDGKVRKSNHYDWLNAVRLRNVTADDFVTLKPGESLVIGPKGKDSALKLEGAATGEHRLKLSYKNTQDGKGQSVAGVWTGTVTANEITLIIK